MTALPSQEDLRQMTSRWLPPSHGAQPFQIHTDTTDFFRVEYGDVVFLNGHPYLIRHNAKEGRFGIDDDVKFWVKRAIDLRTGDLKILKLVFYERLPVILNNFIECIGAIRFLHEHGEKHGDIRRDHILIDRHSGRYRWIDFDFNYRHRENVYGYDLFGLGNVLVFLVGMGDVLLSELKQQGNPALETLADEDLNIVFNHRVANLKKIFPYIPESLNRILMHFSKGANWFYENTVQLLDDLEAYQTSTSKVAKTGGVKK